MNGECVLRLKIIEKELMVELSEGEPWRSIIIIISNSI